MNGQILSILKNCDGTPFVPGSSLAGSMRAYLEKEKNAPCMMGYTDREDTGKMSSLFISDLPLDKELRSESEMAWHWMKIKSQKQANYDMEILEGSAEGHFYLELAVRENDAQEEDEWEQEILASVFQGIQSGEIRLVEVRKREDSENLRFFLWQ